MDLLNSARTFLEESLNNFMKSSGYQAERYLAFSILHATVAVELLLKECLRRIDESLIFITDKNGKVTEKTVGMDDLPSILAAQGIDLAEKKQLIKTVTRWRNYIVHYVPVHDVKARVELERLYDFVYFFLVNHLHEDFRSFLPKDYYQKMEKIIGELQKAINAAKVKARSHGLQDDQNFCPSCYMSGVIENHDGDAYCYLCELELSWAVCPSCEEERPVYAATDNIFGDMMLCRECDERAEQMHIDYLIDKSRGK